MRTVDALGNVHYDDNQVILKGPKAWSNLNTKDTNVWQGDYQMVGRQGRGTADLMKQRGENRYTILENGSFTSCLPGSDTERRRQRSYPRSRRAGCRDLERPLQAWLCADFL